MKWLFPIFVLALLIFPAITFAGQALDIKEEGGPFVWDNSASNPIPLHTEAGACGHLNNEEAVSDVSTSLENWTDLEFVDLEFDIVTGVITVDVNGSNYTDYLVDVIGNTAKQDIDNAMDGINPIVFDDDGQIMELATGIDNGKFTILGFANPTADDGEFLTAGQSVINCYCLEDEDGEPAHDDCPFGIPRIEKNFTIVHEVGHLINLDHTQIGIDLISDGDSDNDDDIATMFPVAINEDQITPVEDDIVALSSLYPSSSFFTANDPDSSNYCLVTGTIFGRFGKEARCVDVQATSSDPFFDVSFVSGVYALAVNDNDDEDTVDMNECKVHCGDFRLYLRPSLANSSDYTLKVTTINPSFTNGSGISPCVSSQLPVCTDSIVSACLKGRNTAGCRACVTRENLTTNISAENILNRIAAECSPGNTVSLGNITTSSISLSFVNFDIVNTSGCSLNTVLRPSSFVLRPSSSFYFLLNLLFLLMMRILKSFRSNQKFP